MTTEREKLPEWLLTLIGEYGFAASAMTDVDRIHHWQELISGIKRYAALSQPAGAPDGVDIVDTILKGDPTWTPSRPNLTGDEALTFYIYDLAWERKMYLDEVMRLRATVSPPPPPPPAAQQDGDGLAQVVIALKRACDEGLIVNPPGLDSDAVGVLSDAANDALAAKDAAQQGSAEAVFCDRCNYAGCECANGPAPTDPDMLRDALLESAFAWWEAHRPVDWTEAMHIASPAVNTSTDAARDLAAAIAAQAKGGES